MNRKKHNAKLNSKDFRLSTHASTTVPHELLSTLLTHPLLKEAPSVETLESPRDLETLNDYCDRRLSQYRKEFSGSETEVAGFRALYQARSLLKKYPFQGNKDECRSNAISKFLEAERICGLTNSRILNKDPEWLNQITFEAKEIIRSVLGPLNVLSLISRAAPGPGLTHDLGACSSEETTAFFKYSHNVSCTKNAQWYTKGLISRDEHWMTTMWLKHAKHVKPEWSQLQQDVAVLDRATYVVPGNRITFVPKDATTDRTIAIEPSGNVQLQLGVGKYIKERLMPYGVNLTDQSKNQEFARLGSIQGSTTNDDQQYSTIDFSMASDTLAFEVVRRLLPADWFAYLCDLRSPFGELKVAPDDVRTIMYEKFSSMGNGYTFELESLIFFALSYASMKVSGFEGRPHSHITVFGDDLIVRKKYVPLITKVIEYYGFSINREKSFVDGPFKESCGRDFLNGVDVRPFFLRRKVRTLADLHFVCNSLMYKSLQNQTSLYWSMYETMFLHIPPKVRLPGPLHFTVIEKELPQGRHLLRRFDNEKLSWRELEADKVDNLESCLRVPLSWAIENGHYRISDDGTSFGYTELKVTPTNFTKRYCSGELGSYTYAARYHIFLQGVRKGDILLRGRTRKSLKVKFTSSWDGSVSPEALRYNPL